MTAAQLALVADPEPEREPAPPPEGTGYVTAPAVLRCNCSAAEVKARRRALRDASTRLAPGTSSALLAGPTCYAMAQGGREVLVHDLVGLPAAALRRGRP